MFKTWLITSTLVMAIAATFLAFAHAQPSAEGPTPAWVVDAGPGDLVIPAVAEPVVEPTPADLLREAGDAAGKFNAMRSAPTLAAIMAFIAALALLLCHGLKVYLKGMSPGGWWKKWIPRFAGLLGVIAAFAGAYTGNMATAVIYGLLPPLAVWANEIYSTSKNDGDDGA